MGSSSFGIAHVMQAIEYSYEIIILPREIFGLGHIECNAIRHASTLGGVAGGGNRFVVIVKADILLLWERPCHQQSGSPFPAANVSHSCSGLELSLDVVQCGNPGTHEIGGIAGTKKLFASMKDAVNVFVPLLGEG